MAHIDQKALAERWLMSPRTLEQWRWQGRGPRYLKLGGRVIYPLSEIEAYEAESLHANTVGPLSPAPSDPRSSSESASDSADGRQLHGATPHSEILASHRLC